MKNIKNKLMNTARIGLLAMSLVGCNKYANIPNSKMLPEVESNQKLVIDKSYIKEYGRLSYTLYTDTNNDGLYDYSKKVTIGNTPGSVVVNHYIRKDISQFK